MTLEALRHPLHRRARQPGQLLAQPDGARERQPPLDRHQQRLRAATSGAARCPTVQAEKKGPPPELHDPGDLRPARPGARPGQRASGRRRRRRPGRRSRARARSAPSRGPPPRAPPPAAAPPRRARRRPERTEAPPRAERTAPGPTARPRLAAAAARAVPAAPATASRATPARASPATGARTARPDKPKSLTHNPFAALAAKRARPGKPAEAGAPSRRRPRPPRRPPAEARRPEPAAPAAPAEPPRARGTPAARPRPPAPAGGERPRRAVLDGAWSRSAAPPRSSTSTTRSSTATPGPSSPGTSTARRSMLPEIRSRIPRLIYEYARGRLTEQDMVEVGSQLPGRAPRRRAQGPTPSACFERHLRKRITAGAVRQIRKHLLSGHFVLIASGSPQYIVDEVATPPARPRRHRHPHPHRRRPGHRPSILPPVVFRDGKREAVETAAGAQGPRPGAQLALLRLRRPTCRSSRRSATRWWSTPRTPFREEAEQRGWPVVRWKERSQARRQADLAERVGQLGRLTHPPPPLRRSRKSRRAFAGGDRPPPRPASLPHTSATFAATWTHVGRLVPLPAERHRGQERAVGLHQQPVVRDAAGRPRGSPRPS